MPGVHMTSTDTTASAARTVITDTDGFYNVPDLPPGIYEMKRLGSRFVTQVMTSIAVAAGAERSLNFVMRAGDPQQVVRTVAPPSQVSSASSTVGGTVGASTVRDTPITGATGRSSRLCKPASPACRMAVRPEEATPTADSGRQ